MLTALLKERDEKIRDLENQLRAAKASSPSSASNSLDAQNKLNEEKRVLLQQKRDLETQMSQLKQKLHAATSAGSRGTVAPGGADVTKMVEERLKDIQAQSAREVESIKARLVAVEKQRDDLSDEKVKLEVEISRIKSGPSSGSGNARTTQAINNAGSSAQLEAATAALKKSEAEVNDLRKRIHEIEAERSNLENAKRTLQGQVDSLQSKVASAEQGAASSAAASADIAKLEKQLTDLASSHAKAQDTLRSENQQQHEQITKLQQQVRDAELALQSAKASESGEISSFKAAMQKELDSARSDIATLDKSKGALEKARDALQAQVESIQAQLSASNAKVASSQESQSSLHNRISELESTLQSRTKEQQQALDASKKDLLTSQSETTTLKGENSKLKSEIQALQASLESASSASASSSSDLAAIAQLEDQLNTALADAKQAQARLAIANSDKDRALKSQTELESKLREVTATLQTQQIQGADTSELNAEIESLEKELGAERNLKNKLEDEKDSLESTVAQLKSKLANATDSQTGAEGQLREARKELDLLRAQLAALEDSISASVPPPPGPPPPAPPAPTLSSSSSPSLSRAPAAGGMNQSLLDSIKNPDVVLKRTSQMLQLPPDVTDGDDILAALARRIIDRRGRMKGAAGDQDDLDEEEW
jgi:chromosome segregation ATPase